jgi:hypothetical protein
VFISSSCQSNMHSVQAALQGFTDTSAWCSRWLWRDFPPADKELMLWSSPVHDGKAMIWLWHLTRAPASQLCHCGSRWSHWALEASKAFTVCTKLCLLYTSSLRELSTVACFCNPSYVGSRDREDHSLRTASEKLVKPHLNKKSWVLWCHTYHPKVHGRHK